MTRVGFGSLAIFLVLSIPATATAQEARSSALAKQLAAALDAAKMDSVAAADPTQPGTFVAVLYFANTQFLAVSAKYTVPQLLNDRVSKKEYRDVYIDLNSAAMPNTKVFVSDLGIDGLKATRQDNAPYDTIEMGGKNWNFDGNWRAAKLSEDEYMKGYQQAEEEYVKMLEALLKELKKTS
jgi:hypothetical protein